MCFAFWGVGSQHCFQLKCGVPIKMLTYPFSILPEVHKRPSLDVLGYRIIQGIAIRSLNILFVCSIINADTYAHTWGEVFAAFWIYLFFSLSLLSSQWRRMNGVCANLLVCCWFPRAVNIPLARAVFLKCTWGNSVKDNFLKTGGWSQATEGILWRIILVFYSWNWFKIVWSEFHL